MGDYEIMEVEQDRFQLLKATGEPVARMTRDDVQHIVDTLARYGIRPNS